MTQDRKTYSDVKEEGVGDRENKWHKQFGHQNRDSFDEDERQEN